MFKVFTTAYIGLIVTILIHGLFLNYSLYAKIESKEYQKKKYRKNNESQEIEIKIKTEDQIVLEEEAFRKKQERLEAAKNVVTDANDKRDKSDTDYSDAYSPSDLNRDIEQEIADIENEAKGEDWDKTTVYDNPLDKNGEDKGDEKPKDKPDEIDPYKSMESGEKAYSGRSMVVFDLPGRTSRRRLKIPAYLSRGTGTVVVDIEVDDYGLVKKATINEVLTTMTEASAKRKALGYAKKEKFSNDFDGPKKQYGSITYEFVGE